MAKADVDAYGPLRAFARGCAEEWRARGLLISFWSSYRALRVAPRMPADKAVAVADAWMEARAAHGVRDGRARR